MDPRIIPGFRYKVRPAENNNNNYIFNGQPLELISIGMGYGKKLTFECQQNQLNEPENYFWSDSLAEGFV